MQDIQYSFNYSDNKIKDRLFKGANYIIRICKSIENEFISKDLLEKKEYLYMKIVNSEIIKNVLNFRLDNILPISRVHIIAYIEKL